MKNRRALKMQVSPLPTELYRNLQKDKLYAMSTLKLMILFLGLDYFCKIELN